MDFPDDQSNQNFFDDSSHPNEFHDPYHTEQQYNPYSSEKPGGDGKDYMSFFENTERFQTHHDAVSFMRDVANKMMFEVTIVSSKEHGREKYVKCSRGIYYKGKYRDLGTGKRKNTKTRACDCPFQLKTVQTDTGEWLIVTKGKGMCGYHNHPLMVYNEGNRQHSMLTREAKEHIKELTEAQSKPNGIMVSLKKKFPTLHPTMKQIYNERSRIRKDSFKDRDKIGQLFYLAKLNKYVCVVQTDPKTNAITHLFMAGPTARDLFNTYPWYVGIDSTYKTNKYKYPFVEFVGATSTNKNFLIAYAFMKDEKKESYKWALTTLKNVIGPDIEPGVIVSDKEGGIIEPIKEVFPKAVHLLCTWHINRDVEAYVYRLYGKKEYGQNIFAAWRRIMNVATASQYESAVTDFHKSFKNQKKFIRYMEGTWLGSKHKFIPAWTNWHLHFGNVTNCRVESAHSSLKKWLFTSTGSLDNIWVKVDHEMEGQAIEIRKTLEHSRNRESMYSTKVPLQNLGCQVSQYCLDLLNEELRQMETLGNEVSAKCGCVLKTTHGIPCACELKQAQIEGIPINVHRIHQFWRTLEIKKEFSEHTNGSKFPSEDHRLFDSLAEDVREEHPQTIRTVNLAIRDILHPEYRNIGEPEIKDKTKGRPKGSTSVRREPSEWEHMKKKLRIDPKNSSQENNQSCNSTSHEELGTTKGPRVITLEQYGPKDLIPLIIRKYIEGVVDVIGDGNCGFRAVASSVYGDEERWPDVRQGAITELENHVELYEKIYHPTPLPMAINRLTWFSGSCGSNHWMQILDDLYPIATFFNVTIIYIGYGTNASSTACCYTILPLYVSNGEQETSQEICVANNGSNHFIKLNLSSTCPVPPIPTTWYNNRNNSVMNWDQSYSERRKLWDSLAKRKK